jgi:hypothetical protein
MIAYPSKNYTRYGYDEKVEMINEALCDLETLRHELGDPLYRAVMQHRTKIAAVINHRNNLRKTARFNDLPNGGRNLDVFTRINQKLPDRLSGYSRMVERRVRDCVHSVIHVENYRNELVTRDDSKPYFIEAECIKRDGWGRSYTNYSANVPRDWHHSPAARVSQLFDHKFFPLQCKRRVDLDHDGFQFYWVNRQKRTPKVGFAPPEEGYAVTNHNEFVGWGTTPELAVKALKKDITKAAKARLLATMKA